MLKSGIDLLCGFDQSIYHICPIFYKYYVYLAVSPSFVVGSDGYIYEGRGWMSVGAHTKGRNTVGYGVAFIGNYAAHLPSKHDMELLRHHLVKCGVSRGFLQKNFTILGHRQVVATTACPGDSLYSEITTWEHYKDTDPLK
ncbi:N-acetylmuramoyl-L-alanine amidase [Labeo rohita]|uniref:N-acetylmuramoyl-L-alanine amidase n=1 Tax=Labeo rohita TaxID=84645 RepID=A0ABQ8ML35_LABRO|nr:N-acetylmuramoyl-L-alanine amidase [Labeo rohita]